MEVNSKHLLSTHVSTSCVLTTIRALHHVPLKEIQPSVSIIYNRNEASRQRDLNHVPLEGGGGGKCPAGRGSERLSFSATANCASLLLRASSSWILRCATSGSPSRFLSSSAAFMPAFGFCLRSAARAALSFLCSSSTRATSPRWR